MVPAFVVGALVLRSVASDHRRRRRPGVARRGGPLGGALRAPPRPVRAVAGARARRRLRRSHDHPRRRPRPPRGRDRRPARHERRRQEHAAQVDQRRRRGRSRGGGARRPRHHPRPAERDRQPRRRPTPRRRRSVRRADRRREPDARHVVATHADDPARRRPRAAGRARDVPRPGRGSCTVRPPTCPAASSRCSPWRCASRAGHGCCSIDELSLGLAPVVVGRDAAGRCAAWPTTAWPSSSSSRA